MMSNVLIAQIVGLFAMAFNVLSYQQKKQRDVIAFQLGGSILFSVNYLMLGAVVGGILNVVAIIRALVFLNREKTNADSLLGKTAIVTEDIDNLAGTGQAQVAGQIWMARAKEEQFIPKGTRVKILEISGVKLMVEPEK